MGLDGIQTTVCALRGRAGRLYPAAATDVGPASCPAAALVRESSADEPESLLDAQSRRIARRGARARCLRAALAGGAAPLRAGGGRRAGVAPRVPRRHRPWRRPLAPLGR